MADNDRMDQLHQVFQKYLFAFLENSSTIMDFRLKILIRPRGREMNVYGDGILPSLLSISFNERQKESIIGMTLYGDPLLEGRPRSELSMWMSHLIDYMDSTQRKRANTEVVAVTFDDKLKNSREKDPRVVLSKKDNFMEVELWYNKNKHMAQFEDDRMSIIKDLLLMTEDNANGLDFLVTTDLRTHSHLAPFNLYSMHEWMAKEIPELNRSIGGRMLSNKFPFVVPFKSSEEQLQTNKDAWNNLINHRFFVSSYAWSLFSMERPGQDRLLKDQMIINYMNDSDLWLNALKLSLIAKDFHNLVHSLGGQIFLGKPYLDRVPLRAHLIMKVTRETMASFIGESQTMRFKDLKMFLKMVDVQKIDNSTSQNLFVARDKYFPLVAKQYASTIGSEYPETQNQIETNLKIGDY